MQNKYQKIVEKYILRTCQWSITANLQSLIAHIYCESWVIQEIFVSVISLKFFWAILNLLFWNLNTCAKLTEQVCFHGFFYLFIFYLLFHNHSVHYRYPPFRTFPLCINTLVESGLFLHIILQSLWKLLLLLSTFCYFCITSQTVQKRKLKALTSDTFCCEI